MRQHNPEVSEGDAFAPFEGTSARSQVPTPKLPPSDAFQLAYDSRRYTVMGGKVIPAFRRVVYTPGLNGCDETRDRNTGARTAIKPGFAKSQMMDTGAILIDFSWIPESQHHLHGNGGKSYLWKPKGRADVVLTIWTECYPGSDQLGCNEPLYLAWIAWLEETGKIPPPPLHILRRLLSQRVEERNQLADRALAVPSLRVEVDRRQKDIAAIEAAIARRSEEFSDAPPADGDAVDMGGDEGGDEPAQAPPRRGRAS